MLTFSSGISTQVRLWESVKALCLHHPCLLQCADSLWMFCCSAKRKRNTCECVCLLVMMCDFAEQLSFAKSQGERCWHGARALMSGVWNSFAVSSDALCRPPLSTFCPVSGLGAAPFAPSLASLACYNEVGIPGMWEYIFPYTPLALLPTTPHQ